MHQRPSAHYHSTKIGENRSATIINRKPRHIRLISPHPLFKGESMPERLRLFLHRLAAWVDSHNRVCVVAGLVISLWAAYRATSPSIKLPPDWFQNEILRQEDASKLYYAAKDASWKDAGHWWVGSWIYPHVAYYRPLTSMLFLAEYQAFDTNFEAYNRVSQAFHLINCALLYFLVLSLFRHRPRSRFLLGLIAVYFFTASKSPVGVSVTYSINWWPAQNDILSLVFGLLSLLLLDVHLCATERRSRRWLLAGSLVSYALAIASKEMGYIVLPMAGALILHRTRGKLPRWAVLDFGAFELVAVFFWALRSIAVPNVWGAHVFFKGFFSRGITYWSGPLYVLLMSRVWWALAVSFSVAIIVGVGLRKRWAVWKILLLVGAASLICAQFVGEDGSWALLFISSSLLTLRITLTYMLAVALFLRYRRVEPGLLAAACYIFVFCPILQFAGLHYFYWPCAIVGLCDAVFCSCLWRWVLELRREADWSLPRFIEARIAAERASATES